MKFRKKKYDEPIKTPEDFNFTCGDFEYKFWWDWRNNPYPYPELKFIRINKKLNVAIANNFPSLFIRRTTTINSDLEKEINDFIAHTKEWITEGMKELKYRVYLKDKTIIDCLDVREEKDKFILILLGCMKGHFSFDEVDMISFIGPKVADRTIDSMALGLEPHKSEAMLRYIRKRFEGHNNHVKG